MSLMNQTPDDFLKAGISSGTLWDRCNKRLTGHSWSDMQRQCEVGMCVLVGAPYYKPGKIHQIRQEWGPDVVVRFSDGTLSEATPRCPTHFFDTRIVEVRQFCPENLDDLKKSIRPR